MIFPAADFSLAQPRFPGDWGAEVMAQVRSNGRITDHWRVALAGTKVLEATFKLASLLPAVTSLPAWTITYQYFPRDIVIRRNMTASSWIDAMGLLAAHEFSVTDEAGELVAIQQVAEAIAGLAAKQNTGSAIRWAVVATPANRIELQLQSLPCSANSLDGKPIFARCVNVFGLHSHIVLLKHYTEKQQITRPKYRILHS